MARYVYFPKRNTSPSPLASKEMKGSLFTIQPMNQRQKKSWRKS
ncbi:rCG61468 [Rattus norvegicus]|uniref:RCG61468 n=1 Tax=Rattus norvegicus TaxID=10116 RepID=A6HAS4_RAT|nr:rCG61468 [Rattus norvegicus]